MKRWVALGFVDWGGFEFFWGGLLFSILFVFSLVFLVLGFVCGFCGFGFLRLSPRIYILIFWLQTSVNWSLESKEKEGVLHA